MRAPYATRNDRSLQLFEMERINNYYLPIYSSIMRATILDVIGVNYLFHTIVNHQPQRFPTPTSWYYKYVRPVCTLLKNEGISCYYISLLICLMTYDWRVFFYGTDITMVLAEESTSPLLLRDAIWNNKYYCYLSISLFQFITLWIGYSSQDLSGKVFRACTSPVICLWLGSLVLALSRYPWISSCRYWLVSFAHASSPPGVSRVDLVDDSL